MQRNADFVKNLQNFDMSQEYILFLILPVCFLSLPMEIMEILVF